MRRVGVLVLSLTVIATVLTLGRTPLAKAARRAFGLTPSPAAVAPPAPPPAISGFSPGSGPVTTIVTINGSGFLGATQVRFGSLVSPAFKVVDDATLLATVPVGLGAPGTTLTVDTPSGSVTSSAIFGVVNGFAWINPAGGNYQTASNWSNNQVPTTVSNVLITLPGNYTVTGPTGGATGSITIGALSGGTQRLDLNSFFSTSGAITVKEQGDLTLSGGSLNVGGTLGVASTFNWNGGNLAASGGTTIFPGATCTIGGTGTRNLGNLFTNQGTTNWAAATTINATSGTQIVNDTTGVFSVTNTVSLTGPGTFVNRGNFQKFNGTGTSNFSSWALQNQGTFFIPLDGIVSFSSATLNNTGTLEIGVSSVSAGQLATAGTTTISGGTLQVDNSSFQTLGNTFNIIVSGGGSGDFTTFNGLDAGSGKVFQPAPNFPSGYRLTVINAPPPTVSGFAPSSGPAGSSVTISGSNFFAVNRVYFNGAQATGYSVDSANQITVTVPNSATDGPVRVVTATGSGSSSTNFTVLPLVSSFTPGSGTATQRVSIFGSGFSGTTAVRFNGTAAGFTVDSPNRITALVPFGATTGPIQVAKGSNTSDSVANFVIAPTSGGPPSITSVSPGCGTVGTGVLIAGSNFLPVTQVLFNSRPAEFTVVGDNRIDAVYPGTNGGPITISVISPNGTASSSAFADGTTGSWNDISPDVATITAVEALPGSEFAVANAFPDATYVGSVNSLTTWNFSQNFGQVTTFAYDPVQSGTIFAGVPKPPAGRGGKSRARTGGAGPRSVTSPLVFASTNNGISWSQADFNIPDEANIVTAMVVFPGPVAGGTSIVIGTDFGVFRSDDRGASWTDYNNGLPGSIPVDSLAYSPAGGGTVYGGFGGAQVFRRSTINPTPWSLASNGLPSGSPANYFLAVDPTNAATAYVAANVFGNGVFAVFKTTDGGANWSLANTGLGSDVASSLRISPNGGVLYLVNTTGLYKSADGAASWNKIGQGLFDVPLSRVAFITNDAQQLLIGTPLGVFRSDDFGQSWRTLNRGFASATIPQIATASGNRVYAQDLDANIYRSNRDGASLEFSLTQGGSPIFLRTAPSDGNTLFTAFNQTETTFLYKSSDGGGSWSLLSTGAARDLAVDPTNPNTVLLIRNGLKQSLDGGLSFQTFGSGFPISGGKIRYAQSNANILYASGNSSEGVFRSGDGGATWSPVNTGLPLSGVNFTALGVDPFDTGGATAYVGTSDARIFRTNNGGANWTQVSSVPAPGYIQTDVTGFAFGGGKVFASFYFLQSGPTATPEGLVQSSADGGNAWTNFNLSGLPGGVFDVAVSQSGSLLFAGTTSGGFVYNLANICATPPVVSSFTPTSGGIGTLVSISGAGFTGATSVSFNGTNATAFTVVNDMLITANVPAGATTGPIAVTTPGGTGTSSGSFTVLTGFNWTNPSGGDFSTASNWSGGVVPGPGDTATFNLTGGYTVTGTGTVANVVVSGGTVDFNGTVTTGGLNLSGGAFSISGGTFTLNGAGSITGSNSFTFNGGTLAGTGTLTLSGTGTFNAGTIASGTTFTVPSGATVTFATTGLKTVNGTFNNAGTVAYPGTNFQLNPGLFNNQSGGLFDIQGNGNLSLTAGATFNNLAGATLLKSAGTGLSNLFGNVVNSGTLTCQAGTMRSLALTINNGAVFTQSGGTISLETLTTLASGATFSSNGARINGQILGGPGTLASGSAIEFFGGTLNDNATLTISSGAQMLVTSGVTKTIRGTLNNAGSILYQGTGLQFVAGTPTVFNNQAGGVFDIQGDGNIQSTGGTFNNAGTVQKSGGTGISSIDVPFVNSGTLITPSLGGRFLLFNGTFSQTAAGTTTFDIGGTTAGNGFSQLQFAGTPSFAGTATVALTGGFTPTAGQTFDIIRFGARTGAFSTVNLPPNSTGIGYSSGFLGDRFRVTVSSTVPTVTSFTPTSGNIGSSVTLTGTNFTGATAVRFNGTNAPGFTVVNDTTITVTVPFGATTGPISVTTTNGTGSSAANFTVNLTYNWINPAGGNFSDPTNWSSGIVPGPGEVAVIDLPGTYTVTSGSLSLGGLMLGGVGGTQTLLFSGNLALGGPAVINPNGFFSFGDGTISGPGTVTVAGQMSFIGGGAALSAGIFTIQSGAVVSKNTPSNVSFNNTVNNSGTFITPDNLNVNAAFNNLSGAVFEVRGDGGFAGGGPFNIAAGATFRKTLGTSTFTPSGTPVNNDGTLECQSGVIDLQSVGAGAGEFRSSAGASIIFRGDYTFNNGAQLNGTGTNALPANITLNGTVTMRNASIGGLGNTIGGPGTLIIPNSGAVAVTGGGATFAGTGTIEVQNGGTFNLNGIGHTFNRTLNNAGIINWSQLDITIGTGAAINNLAGGFFRVQHSDRFITGGGSFNNAGTFEQPGGASVTVNVPFTNSGVINVPAVGFMTIANLVQTPAGTINTQLGGTSPGGNYSQLRTTNLTAAGTFSAAYINGFTATPGQFFDVVTFSGTRTGTFSTVNLPPAGPGQTFASGFKPNSFVVALVGTPSISSFSPTSGIVGTSVTITGTNFTGTSSVRFNGTNAPGFTVDSDTQITASVPTGATTGPISVSNTAGTGTSATNFTVFLTPNIASFNPTSGPVGTSVTVTGTHFTGTTSVAFNGTNAPAFTVNSDTQITVAVPNGATTGPISVTNPAGTGTSSGTFTVFQTPTVTSFTPTSGTFGTAVTITGTNFTGTTAVTFNGTAATGFTVVNPTTITVNVPTGASTGPIAVTNPAGTGTSSANFNVVLTFNWINPSGGDFNIGANWSSGVVPGPTDFAVIDLPGTYSVTVTNVAVTLGGLTLGGLSGTQTLVISNTLGGGFTLNGPGTVNPNGRITFNAGVLGGAGGLNLTAGSTMTLESAFGKAVAGTLNNAGTIAYVSGSSDLTVSGTLNNQAGGLFDIPTDNTITVSGALSNLAGATIRKSAGTGPSFITTTGAGTFDNFGTLLCQSGQLRPNSVRIQNGSTFTATGSGLLLLNSTSGTTTFAAGSPTFTSNGATIDGDLAGTGSFTGTLKFNAGTITGTLNVTSGSTLTVLNTTFGKAVSGTLNNSGTVNYLAPSFDLNINPGGTFNNLSGGLFDLNTDNGLVINTSAAFNNQAGSTFRKSGGTGTSVVANSGTFTNSGAIVAPLTGFLQINGLFTQTGTGVINATLNGTTAGTNYSQLQLQSPTLGGTLNVALQGGFTPVPGNTFDVVTFSGPRTGGFASVNLPPPSTGISYSGNFTGVASGAFRVVVNSTVPTVTSFTPTSGPVGTSVTITGTNFTGTTAVRFNGTSAPGFTVVNDTTITVSVPTGATTGTISVTNPAGTGTSIGVFTIIPAPTVTSFSPTSGGIGVLVTVSGTGLTGATAVRFNGTPATSFTVVNDTTITVNVPSGATSGPISVTTAGGTGTSSGNFTVIVGFDWINPSGGDFNTPGNWSGGIVPGPSDTAIFSLAAVYTVTGTGTVAGISQTAGNVTFNGTFTTGTFSDGGGSIALTNLGALNVSGFGTVNHLFINNGGTLTIGNTFTVNGRLDMPSGTIQGPGDLLDNSTFNWDSGTVTGTGSLIVNGISGVGGAFLNIQTAAPHVLNRNILASPTPGITGFVTDSAPNLTFGTGVTITNSGEYFLDVEKTYPATLTFNNTNRVNKVTGTGTFEFAGPFNNGGQVAVHTGEVRFTGGGTQISGNGVRYSALANGTITFAGGSFTLGPAEVAGGQPGGLVRITGSTTITLASDFAIGDPTRLETGASITGPGSLIVIDTGTLDWQGGTIGGDSSAGNLTVNGGGGQLLFNGPDHKDLGRTLLNDGLIVWNDGEIRGNSGPTPPSIYNRSTGVFRIQNDGDSMTDTGSFINQGLSEKPSGSGTNLITWNFDNEGILRIPATTGILFIENYTQMAGGFLEVTIGGMSEGVNLSQLQTINASLDGTLNISLANGFTPTQGQRFPIITYDTGVVRPGSAKPVRRGKVGRTTPKFGSGSFAHINGANIGNGLVFQPDNTPGAFFLKTAGAPVITSFSPASGPVGTTVTITGLDFQGATLVRFTGGTEGGASFTVSPLGNQITATVPTGATNGPITVTTPLGTATSPTSFLVFVTPIVTSFTPTSGPVGTSVTITGMNFTGASAVTFNGTNAPAFTFVDDTTITATVPNGATTGPIAVTNPAGTGTSSASFTVFLTPTVTSFTPASGPVGTAVTITGTNFTGTTSVAFNGTNASSFTLVNDTTITTTVPNGATTGPISVTNPAGTGTSTASFVVIQPPTITGFSPASGTIGTLVTISGTSFDTVTSVKFNGVEALFTLSPLTGPVGPTEPVGGVRNPGGEPVAKGAGRTTTRQAVGLRGGVVAIPKVGTILTATVPNGATSGFITITNPAGTATSATPFGVLFPPVVTSFTPQQGPPGTSVVITGTFFNGATGVTFGGVPATTFTVNSPTQITAVVPANGTTGKIGVTTPDGSGLSIGTFVVCGYTVDPTAFTIAGTGGDRSLTVTPFSAVSPLSKIGVKDVSLCPWTAVSNSPFITILSGATGSGNGTVTFRIAPFTGTGSRTGSLTVAGQTVTITQQAGPAPGDFNADLSTDLVWRNVSTGANSIWLMNGTTFSQNIVLASSETCWFVGGVTDFTGDLRPDILWRNQTITGANGLWRFNGTTVVEGLTITPSQPDLNWAMNCTADFNADGKADIVLRNTQTRAAEIWLMNGLTRSSVVPFNVSGVTSSDEYVGSGDFNGDGKPDLLIRNQAAGTLRVLTLNGTTPTGTLTIPTLNSNWFLSAVGDFNQDGRPDIVWRNQTDGSNVIWLMNGTTLLQSVPFLAVTDTNWRIVGPK